MAVIARKIMGYYQCHCTTCGKQWVSEDHRGGEEGAKHKH